MFSLSEIQSATLKKNGMTTNAFVHLPVSVYNELQTRGIWDFKFAHVPGTAVSGWSTFVGHYWSEGQSTMTMVITFTEELVDLFGWKLGDELMWEVTDGLYIYK